MNSILYSFEDDERHFETYYYINSIFSPSIKKINNNIVKEEFGELEENFKDNKDNCLYSFIEKTKAISKDNNNNFQKENEGKKIIKLDDNFSLFNFKQEKEENQEIQQKEKKEKKEEEKNINLDNNFSLFNFEEENEKKEEKLKEEKKEKNEKNEKKEENEEKLEILKKTEKNEKKRCGRKKLRNDDNDNKNQNVHNKYSDDNIRRKIKHIILKNILIFLNNQIKKIYNGNIGNGIFKKELQTINQSQKSDATINFNKNFLNKQISDIFSDKISGRYTNYPPYHNKRLIIQLLNEKDENKRIYFRKLFCLNFMDCLKHFRGEKHIDMLDGLICFKDVQNEIINKYNDGNDYYQTMKYYLDNFEKIINKKKPRKSRKKVEK